MYDCKFFPRLAIYEMCLFSCPGIGYGMVLISGIVCVYYNIIITWTIYYLIKSCSPVLPWSTCNNPWNTPACVSQHTSSLTPHNVSASLNNTYYPGENGTDLYVPSLSDDYTTNWNDSTVNMTPRKSASEEFWE